MNCRDNCRSTTWQGTVSPGDSAQTWRKPPPPVYHFHVFSHLMHLCLHLDSLYQSCFTLPRLNRQDQQTRNPEGGPNEPMKTICQVDFSPHILASTFSSPFLCLSLSTTNNLPSLSHPALNSRSTSDARSSRDPCKRDTHSSLRGAEVDVLRSNSAEHLPRSAIALLSRHVPIITANSRGTIPTPHGTTAATI
jgi:hypothetical protein